METRLHLGGLRSRVGGPLAGLCVSPSGPKPQAWIPPTWESLCQSETRDTTAAGEMYTRGSIPAMPVSRWKCWDLMPSRWLRPGFWP